MPEDELDHVLREIGNHLASAVKMLFRLFNSGFPVKSPADEEDVLISMEEAANRLHLSKTFLYQNKDEFPFIVRLPKGQYRVSAKALKRYMEGSR